MAFKIIALRAPFLDENPATPNKKTSVGRGETGGRISADIKGSPDNPAIAARRREAPHIGDLSRSSEKASSVEAYSKMLPSIFSALEDAGYQCFLYGSAALRFLGDSRLDPTVIIKDLDMALQVPARFQGRETERAALEEIGASLKEILKAEGWLDHLNLPEALDTESAGRFSLTQNGTFEFISEKETIQFSFNVRTSSQFESERSKCVEQAVTKGGRAIFMRGSDYIRDVLPELISKNLSRPDKFHQILRYLVLVCEKEAAPLALNADEDAPLSSVTMRLAFSDEDSIAVAGESKEAPVMTETIKDPLLQQFKQWVEKDPLKKLNRLYEDTTKAWGFKETLSLFKEIVGKLEGIQNLRVSKRSNVMNAVEALRGGSLLAKDGEFGTLVDAVIESKKGAATLFYKTLLKAEVVHAIETLKAEASLPKMSAIYGSEKVAATLSGYDRILGLL